MEAHPNSPININMTQNLTIFPLFSKLKNQTILNKPNKLIVETKYQHIS